MEAESVDKTILGPSLVVPTYRCTECGDGSRLHAWAHVLACGPVDAKGVVERYDWTDDDDDLIEETVSCGVHGENFVEKLVEGEYTAAMIGGRFVSATVALAEALLNDSDVKYDRRHRELYNLALRVSGRGWGPMSPQVIERFSELAKARTQQVMADRKSVV